MKKIFLLSVKALVLTGFIYAIANYEVKVEIKASDAQACETRDDC